MSGVGEGRTHRKWREAASAAASSIMLEAPHFLSGGEGGSGGMPGMHRTVLLSCSVLGP